MQLLGELLARRETRVELQELHQVDDRLAPVELLLVLLRELGQHRLDVDRRHRRGRRRRRCCSGGAARRGCRCRCPRGSAAENGRHDLAEDAHGCLLTKAFNPIRLWKQCGATTTTVLCDHAPPPLCRSVFPNGTRAMEFADPKSHCQLAARFSANEASPSIASGDWRFFAWLSTSRPNVAASG